MQSYLPQILRYYLPRTELYYSPNDEAVLFTAYLAFIAFCLNYLMKALP